MGLKKKAVFIVLKQGVNMRTRDKMCEHTFTFYAPLVVHKCSAQVKTFQAFTEKISL